MAEFLTGSCGPAAHYRSSRGRRHGHSRYDIENRRRFGRLSNARTTVTPPITLLSFCLLVIVALSVSKILLPSI